MRTLGTSDSSTLLLRSIPLSDKAAAIILAIDARMQTGEYDKAVETALAMEEGPERDVCLKEVADRLVPPEAQLDLNRIDSGTDQTRANTIESLRKLVHISGLVKGGLIKSRLLIRAAMVKRLLDKVKPGAEGTKKNDLVPESLDLVPESLVASAEKVAKAMPTPDTGPHPFRWVWGLLLSRALGIAGFVSTHT